MSLLIHSSRNLGNMCEWLAEAFIKRLPTEKELEMPDIPYFSVYEGPLRLRETAMLEWVCCVKPNPPQWKGPEHMNFMHLIRGKMERRAPVHLKSLSLSLS